MPAVHSPLWLSLLLLATGCSVPDLDLGAEPAVIGSDTVAPSDDRAPGQASGGATAGVDLGDPVTPADEERPDVAPGSTDPAPELSTDPDAVYVPGTCFRRGARGSEAVELPCDEPHTIEVYANRDLPGGDGAPFLGLDAAVALCDDEFRAITGVGIGLATVFERSVLRPSEETWADGERDVTCYVVYPQPIVERLAELDPVRGLGRVSLYGLEVGDCIVDFDEVATWFVVVPCTEPHDAEVFVDHEFPDGPFPGDGEIDVTSDDLCYGATFEEYVGLPYADSTVYSLRSRPTADTWEQGDRTVNCILTDELVHTESFAGSGL
jgi:hypothetical protein